MKGKVLQKFMRQTGRSFEIVGKTLSAVDEKAPVAAALKEISKQEGLEYGTTMDIRSQNWSALVRIRALELGSSSSLRFAEVAL